MDQDDWAQLKAKMNQLSDLDANMTKVLRTMSDQAAAIRSATARSHVPAPQASPDDGAMQSARVEAVQQTHPQIRDSRLEGHWRCTPTALSSGGYSMTTDIHLVLDAAGRFIRWSESTSSMGSIEGDREYGSWANHDGTLVLSYDDESETERAYDVGAQDLLFDTGGPQRHWVRVR